MFLGKCHIHSQEVIEGIGMGPAQVAWGLLGGGIWLADGAELLLVSSVTRCVNHRHVPLRRRRRETWQTINK